MNALADPPLSLVIDADAPSAAAGLPAPVHAHRVAAHVPAATPA